MPWFMIFAISVLLAHPLQLGAFMQFEHTPADPSFFGIPTTTP